MSLPSSIPAALAALQRATHPEALFGKDPATLKDSYRDWAKLVHEDVAPPSLKATAHEAFVLLTKWYEEGEGKVRRGTYGDCKPRVVAVLRTKTVSYSLTSLVYTDDIADVYQGESDKGVSVRVRVVGDARDSDLMKREADLLARLPAALPSLKLQIYFPNLLDSFETDGTVRRRINVFAAPVGAAVSLAQVHEAYPGGLNPADAAWMWNRMLEALHLLHTYGPSVVHGALTPDRFFIVPDSHLGFLTDFSYSVPAGSPAKAISPPWRGFYPPEVAAKKGLDTGTDLYMAGRIMEHLIGGIDKAPEPLARLLRACWLSQPARIRSAEDLHSDFKDVCRRLFGPKRFRPFEMPSPSLASV